ncbi:hypothetical protein BH23ACT10_BH23ACT10_07140 [soil metagenome]
MVTDEATLTAGREGSTAQTVATVDLTDPRKPASANGRDRPFRWFTPSLALLLFGYMFFSRTFAYIHIPGTPVFIGEIVMVIGIIEAARVRPRMLEIVGRSPILRALLAFMALCTVRLVVDLPRYGIDAIRDSATWYYGVFAFLVAAAVVYDPTFTTRMLRWYRRAIPWFFIWTPFAIVLSELDSLSGILIPDTATPINSFRPSDYAVHVAMAIAYPWLGINRLTHDHGRPQSELALGVVAIIALLMAGSQNRGGLAAAMLMMAIVMFYLPTGRRRGIILPVLSSLLVVLGVILLLDLRIPGERRDVSVQQVAQNLSSLGGGGDEDLSGTVEWRTKLWTQVVDDLTSSTAWATGLGFGPILPKRYEVALDPNNPNPLRSVHNSHLTVMARVGYGGFALWVLLWTTWTAHLVRFVRHRPDRLRDPSAAMSAWLLGATAAALVNAFFDPALEGPHAAVWLYALVGLGAAHTIYRPKRPQLAARWRST